jgi:signal transduction histidine kinase
VNENDHAWAAGLWASGSPPANAATDVVAERELSGTLRLRDARKTRGAPLFLVSVTAGFIALLLAGNTLATETKRVLIVNSFGAAAPPFTIHSTSFESELVTKMGERIALDEVTLDMARNDESEMQQAMVEYLEKRQAKWKPDLVVPIGSPAAVFVVNNHERLFPETPILIVAGNRQFLPSGSWEKNAAFVGHAIDIPGFFEDMLQVAPATKNIEIVMGATSLERTWREAFQKAAGPFADRIKFTYYNDLSFDQMLERAAKLPPNSYIFFLLLLRDVAGVTPKSDEALQRLHQVAIAPMNGLFIHQLGMGIVGGRLLDGDQLGKEAADIAMRILRGEPASSIPPLILKQAPPRYDWRELQRWKINEKLLPPRSTVLFREPTVWDRYQMWILAGVSVLLLQALLIAGLLANRFKRRRAERSLKRAEEEARHQREQINLLGRVSLLGEMTASLAHELNQPLSAIIANANAGKRFIDRDKADLEPMHEILTDVVADARRAHGIIQNVRDTVKKGDSIRRRIDVNELVEKVAHIVRPDALVHSCEVETSLAEHLPSVEGDPIQIQQVLVNLVSNAFDSMRQTPKSERKVEITTAGDGNGAVHLSVRDHGTGIRSDAHGRLFDQFFTTKEQGLGMGLAIVRSIVEAHGGKIDAENAADGGARFQFTLPVAKPTA